MIHLSDHNLIVLIVFLDPKNLYLDTKIIVLGAKVPDLQSFKCMAAIFGGHLEYFKTLKGAAPAPFGFMIWRVLRHENH